MELVRIDIHNEKHQQALLFLMNDYMLDEMGIGKALETTLGDRIIIGLKEQNNYLGFLLSVNNEFVGLANCFVAFSTFKAQKLFNIHDYIINKSFRGSGLGRYFLEQIKDYAARNNFCKITLEVRYDNDNAQGLYKSLNFKESEPPMYFWSVEM